MLQVEEREDEGMSDSAYEEVLAYLSSFPGRGWVPGPLVRKRCNATPAATDRALAQLVSSGRVEKMPDVRDRRRNVYRLSHAPLRLIVGCDKEPAAPDPLMPSVDVYLSLDVMECGHTAVSHFLPEAKASPYVHDLKAKTVRRRCLECAPSAERKAAG